MPGRGIEPRTQECQANVLTIEPLFFRFKNVKIPFQDLLIPFFTVSDI